MKPYKCPNCTSLININPYVSEVKIVTDYGPRFFQIEAKVEWICPNCGHHNTNLDQCTTTYTNIYKFIREVNGND